MKVYQVLLIYQYLSLSGYQVLLQQSQAVEMLLTHDSTQPSPTGVLTVTQSMDNSGLRKILSAEVRGTQ